METDKILTRKEILEQGLHFGDDNIDYGGEYGQQVCKILEDGTEEPVTGLLYEFYKNSNLVYYQYYFEGIPNGPFVWFYENGAVQRVSHMEKGARQGRGTEWYENGQKKSEGIWNYGYCEFFREWDENGNMIAEQLEPTDFEKRMIEKFKAQEQRLKNKEQ